MTNEKNATKAGLFIVGCVLLAAGILVGIKGAGTLMVSRRDVIVAFDLAENLGGLKVGDPVRVGGFGEGRVKDIRYVAGDEAKGAPRFEVRFSLPTKYELKHGALVQIEQGLTGTSNLNITAFGSGPVLKDSDVLNGAGSALGDFYAIAPEARGLIADVRAKVEPAYKAYEGVTTTGREALANVRDVLGDSKTDIRGSLANINAATGTLKDRLPQTLNRADAFLEKTTATVESARGTLEDVRQASANLKEATAEARSILVRNRSKIDNMVTSLRGTSTNLESASSEIRRSPWRLLYQPKAEELENLNVYDSARAFAEAATRLNDTASAVRDAARDSGSPPDRMEALMNELNVSFTKYKTVENHLWDAVKTK